VPGRYPSLENDAHTVRSFDLTILHGLLQTEEYYRSVVAPLLPRQTTEAVEQLVALRLRRQEALSRLTPRPLEMIAVIDEVVLQRPVGGHAVMAAQLDRLLETAQLPNVTLRVLPFAVGILRAHAGHFVLLDIPAELGSDVVFIEGHAGDTYLDTESDLQLFNDVFADVLDSSLSPDDSAAVIARYGARHTPP
jgi:Domain of unknown function (DUF5753)